MKTKVNFNHRLMMVLLVMGSVFSMIVSSAFTTNSAWAASLAQSGGSGVASMSSINPASLPIESAHSHNSAKHQQQKHEKNEDTNSSTIFPAPLTEVSGTVSDFLVISTTVGPRAVFSLNGVGVRMDDSLITGFTISNGDSVTVEGYYLGRNDFQVTEVDRAQ